MRQPSIKRKKEKKRNNGLGMACIHETQAIQSKGVNHGNRIEFSGFGYIAG